MINSHKQFQETLEEVSKLTLKDKDKFFDTLLFNFTISSRGIWSDDKPTDTQKVEAFKWLNELLHRIWNIKYEIYNVQDNDSVRRLYENLKFYADQSPLLEQHLVPTVLSAFKNFKERQ